MYNKLFTKILDSSIWLEPTHIRLVWLTMIAAMDEDGFAQFASVANLAYRARLTEEETQEAVDCLSAPDPNSSDQDFEGRRIERVPGGWQILNASKYREIVTREVAREKTRLRVAKFRESKRAVTNSNAPVTVVKRPVTPSEADTVSRSDTDTVSRSLGFAVPACFENIEGFTAALAGWIEHRKKIRKPATGRAIQLLVDKLSSRPHDAVRALDAIVMNGWQGFEWGWIDKNGITHKGGPLRQEDVPPTIEV